MAYNSGIISLFNQAQNYTNVFADLKAPTFAPPATFLYTSVYGKSVAPTIATTGTGVVNNAFGQQIAPTISASGITVSLAYGLNLAGPTLTTGRVTTVYTLFAAPPSGAGTISGSYGAYFGLPTVGVVQGGVGIGTTTPRNALDVNGALAVGSYAGVNTLSSGTFAVSGTSNPSVGVGLSNPSYYFDVAGTLAGQYVYGLSPQGPNQLIRLAQGYSQGGFGSSFVGTQKTMSANTSINFDSGARVNSRSRGYAGAVFDGRYVYYIPNFDGASRSGLMMRYDTTQSYSSSNSYAIFETGTLSSISKGFLAGAFDGRYVYLIPNVVSTCVGLITRYDTTLPFSASSSYSIFDTFLAVSTFSCGFVGSVFDNRYLYLVPNLNTSTTSGVVLRYDTTLPFATASSYLTFDMTLVQSNSRGFFSGVFDGRYIYYVPNFNGATQSGQITRYDTSSSFGSSSSYAVFDLTTNVSLTSSGFRGAVFDGRYIYYVPFRATPTVVTNNGQITRYDTLGSFTSASSYSIFNTSTLNTLSIGFFGAVFDQRYLYLVPGFTTSGQITRYDTTQYFFNTSSYTSFSLTAALTSLSAGFFGGISDGRYIYFVPHQNGATVSGLITRIDSYSGPNANTPVTSGISNNFSVGAYAGVNAAPSNSLIVSGNVGIGTSNPQYLLDVNGSISAQYAYGLMPEQPNQTISLAQGYNQGSFGGGVVGSQKTPTTNTTNIFNLALVNSNGVGFSGTAFDGRFVYYAPNARPGFLFRYDTTQSFSSSTSYFVYDLRTNVNTTIPTFSGAIYDGRYIYFPSPVSSFITRYDTGSPFNVATSYVFLDLGTVASVGASLAVYRGGVYDGRYVYFAPASTTAANGTVVRYDTTLSFTSTNSYTSFNTTNIQSNSRLFYGAVYDGRYIYFIPSSSPQAGQVTRYDTSLSFGTATSYSVFDMQANVDIGCQNFLGAVYDGRFIYYVPLGSGQITRYDTTGSFTSSSYYSFFNTTTSINSLASSFTGGAFDGRYVYFFGRSFPNVVVFDTSVSFSNGSSYSLFSTGSSTASSGIFDGRYIYIAPGASTSNIARLDAYSGAPINAISASQFPSTFAIGNFAGVATPPNNSLIVSGNVGFGTSSPGYAADVNGNLLANYVSGLMPQQQIQTIALSEGYNQGGFSGGSVGIKKEGSAGTTLINLLSIFGINSTSSGINAAGFDGRYVYMCPSITSTLWRYDTQLPITSASSFDSASLVGLNPAIGNTFTTTGYDGRYLYLASSSGGIFVRYDTTLPFKQISSYASFNMTAVSSSFSPNGMSFDGRYLYFAPTSGFSTIIIRYDTSASFQSTSSYRTFDASGVVSSGLFYNSVFDGRYIYFVPISMSFGLAYAPIMRYDTSLSFNSASSYSTFYPQTLNTLCQKFFTACFDGRFVYFLPQSQVSGEAILIKYDTTLPFTSTSSYSLMGSGSINSFMGSAGLYGCSYDGRYLYMPANQVIIKYDTTQSFNNASSYSSIFVGINSQRFTVWDGRYAYFFTTASGATASRIDALSTSTPVNALATYQVPSSFSIGNYAGVNTPPSNGLIMSGGMAVGNTSPNYFVDVNGSINASSYYGLMPQAQNQLISLTEGNNQSGLGGSFVGLSKTMSANTTLTFDVSTLNTVNAGFQGAVFDGRYIYFIPIQIPSRVVVRYDTLSSFSSSTSYSSFNVSAIVVSFSTGITSAIFDGRYVYYIPSILSSSVLFLQYDTTLPFTSLNSYQSINASGGYSGGVFDGRYVYFIPSVDLNNTAAGLLVQYDTTQSFFLNTASTSINLATISTASVGFAGGVYDGRYVYLVPNANLSTWSGQITRYDTTQPFSLTTSYSFFDLATINTFNRGYFGGVFDGRYVYFVPNNNGTPSGLIARFDSLLTFTSSSSYSFFDTSVLQSNAKGFEGAIFDNRYIYFVPNAASTASGLVVRYDTTGSFFSSSNYTIFNLGTQVNSLSTGFSGGVYDGKYVYLSPNINQLSYSGLIARIDAYPGPLASALAFNKVLSTSLAVGTYVGAISPPANSLIVSGQAGFGTADTNYTLNVFGTTNATVINRLQPQQNSQLISLAEGNNQGSFGGGALGNVKGLSANTTQVFNTQAFINSNSVGFFGGVFDGRYIYLVPSSNPLTRSGQVTRYDTSQPFSASSSYAVFDMKTVDQNSVGFQGGAFDGRYIYYAPNVNSLNSQSGQITRFDTNASFTSAGSYIVYDTKANVNSTSIGFTGAVFDGRYVYFAPHNISSTTQNGQITRYDTTASFTTASSYSVFDLVPNVNSLCTGLFSGTYDGRYIYYPATTNDLTSSGIITRYDTTLPFATASSYSFFDTKANVNSNSNTIIGTTFDGRYVYYISNFIGTGFFLKYDTTLPFATAGSYIGVSLSTLVNSLCSGYEGLAFDGRYVYLAPNDTTGTTKSGLLVSYDTTKPFVLASSYSIFDSTAFSSNSSGFVGALYDGRYVYFLPNTNGSTRTGMITRVDAYPASSPATVYSATQAPNGFAVGSYAGNIVPTASNLIVPGKVGVNNANPIGTLDVVGAIDAKAVYGYMPQGQNQKINVASGYAQGSFGGSFVGSTKAMSINSEAIFPTQTFINSQSRGFDGGVFDGRYLYVIPSNTATNLGIALRYDTTLPFGNSSSYGVMYLSTVNANGYGFRGGVFDGRYVYYINNATTTTLQYDTTLPFNATTSYQAIVTTTINGSATGFSGGIFDGRYIYYVPYNGILIRYDTTTQAFSSSASWSAFSVSTFFTVSTYWGGTFDGQYIYFPGYLTPLLMRYDTTKPFSVSTSYASFSLSSFGYNSGIASTFFDGRFVYLPSPTNGVVVRYDTNQNFSITQSYSVFITTTVGANNQQFIGGCYDGRYVYLTSQSFSQITRYDTSLPFSVSTSYSSFDASVINSNSSSFSSGVFDGRYVYFARQNSGFGIITRIDGYPGASISPAMASSQATNGFSLGSSLANVTTNGTASAGSFAIPAQAAGFIVISVNGTPQKIPYYNL
ncbi:MAG: hypothetical protein JSS32_06145 [Verrucomicrobia bacterium]|nr:hypothetical protein [Verrucomicrobiota bacterium]